jgi:hypothetical protein
MVIEREAFGSGAQPKRTVQRVGSINLAASSCQVAAKRQQRRSSAAAVLQVIDWMVAREASLRDVPRVDNSYTPP